jgi:hypothetical protein
MNHDRPAGHGDLADLVASLSALAPAAAQLDRDRVLFRAGQAASSRGRREAALATLAGVMTLAVVVLGGALWRSAARPPAGPIDSLREDALAVDVPARLDAPRRAPPTAEHQSPGGPTTNYVTVRDLVIARGVDAWLVADSPEPAPQEPRPEPTRAQLLEELLREADAAL